NIGAYFTENATLSKPLLTYAEVCFSRAEAAFRGWTADNAQTWYENGVRASMSSYGITEATISTFLAGGGLFNNT
ncbi:MAG TPA: SusD/RagB family nutrient-binding outer membrane lipoprotein, partial [Marinilabiliales bacterium]|nr:SusD/RagB family nutrient-binding outer membrane lipoprotein [Marinilabiliales bacterium]